MELLLYRKIKTGKSTIGKISENGKLICLSLEDRDRGLKQGDSLLSIKARKIFGITAIPAGRYEVIMSFSSRFQKYMPQLLNVPGYEGVRIHCGNKPEDTEGCILVGMSKGAADTIAQSRLAYDKLTEKIMSVEMNEKIFITIQ